jgi:simple sugar transport system permease protein
MSLLRALASIAAIVLAMATVGIFLAIAGVDPLVIYGRMAQGAVGDAYSLSAAITKTVPVLLPALGIAVALRAGLWNIGAEGQIYMGAAAATAVAVFGPPLPFPLSILVALIAGGLAGALWASIPGLLRAFRGVNEVITSLMMVYIAVQFANYLLEGPWGIPGATFPASPPANEAFRLPALPGSLLNAGVVVAIVALLTTIFIFDYSVLGLRLKAVGGNSRAAQHMGVDVKRMIVSAMMISGAFAGVAGAVEVIGVRGTFIEGFSPGYGFAAIAVALLGQLNPFGIVAAALLFGVLDAGGAGLVAASQGLPYSIVQTTEGLAVVYVLIALGLIGLYERRREARAALETTRAASVAAEAAS